MDKFPYVLMGDLEGAIIHILSNAPEITGFAGGAPTVSSTLDGFRRTNNRWIAVSLEGGGDQYPVIAKSRVDFNVFAETRTIAHNLAQIAMAVIFRERGQPFPAYRVRYHDVKVETGLVRADDKLSDSPRYLFALRIHHAPRPNSGV